MHSRKTLTTQGSGQKRHTPITTKKGIIRVHEECGSAQRLDSRSNNKPTKQSQMSTGDKSDRDESRSSDWSSDEDIESSLKIISPRCIQKVFHYAWNGFACRATRR